MKLRSTPYGDRAGEQLLLAMLWWIQVLQRGICESVPLKPSPQQCVDLFADAAGAPAKLAAVLVCAGRYEYTTFDPSLEIIAALDPREDAQIMALELMAILVALRTFGPQLRGQTVRVWSDNVGAECTLRAGTASCIDHNLLVYAVWLEAIRHGLALWFERVPSDDNIADEPSRNLFVTVENVLGAAYVPPCGTGDLGSLGQITDASVLAECIASAVVDGQSRLCCF